MARKLISIILALFMAFTVMPVGVNAGEDGREVIFNKLENTAKKQLKEDQVFKLEDINPSEEVGSSEGQAYAVFTNDGKLIFFRSNEIYGNKVKTKVTDIFGNNYEGVIYSNIETLQLHSAGDQPWCDERNGITTVCTAKNQVIQPISTGFWFAGFNGLKSIDFTDINLDTSNVSGMYYMFYNCVNLTSLDLSSFDTSNVKSMQDMFDGCKSLTSLDLSSFDTSNVFNMDGMFSKCSSLTHLDVSSFDTSNVTSMVSMFSSGDSLKSVKLGSKFTKWASGVTLPTGLWINKASCVSVSEQTLRDKYPQNASSWAGEWIRVKGSAYATLTNKGELIFFRSYNAYSNNKKGTFEDISGNQYSGTVFSGIETQYTGQYGDPKQNVPWFDYMESIKSVRVADCEEQLICPVLMSYWFNDCINLSNANMDGFVTFGVQRMIYMFNNCDSLTSLNVSGLDARNVINMGYMFSNCNSLIRLDLSGFDTSNVTSMSNMFSNCSSLTSLDVSSFDTSNVTDMESMFSNCSSLTGLDLSGFDTSNVSYMSGMFYKCSSMISLNVSGFKTSKVIGMDSMFSNCSSLTSLDLSGFKTSKVTDMSSMFSNCSSLTSLDLSGFDTSNVTCMINMFYNSSSLTSLDLSGFDTSNVWDQKNRSMAGMFSGLNSLVSVKLGRKFTQWNRNAYLPEGIWINTKLNISLSEKQLYAQYPSHSNEWAGTWIKYDGMPKSIRLNQGNATITVNDTLQLYATVEPENATNKTVSWSSNNDNVATVNSSGQVIGKTVGKAIITAATVNGLTDTCRLDVLFKDVADSSKFFYNPVYWAYFHDPQITTGTSISTFSPNNDVTRGQIVAFLYRAAGEPAVTGEMPFTDVKEGKFYYNAVLWAYKNGITTGTSDTTFSPNGTCIRSQIVAFLWRYCGSEEVAPNDQFKDVKKGSFYEKAVAWAVKKGVTTGTSATTFSPNENCTRGQAVTFLYRAVKDK